MLLSLKNIKFTYSPDTPFATMALNDISLDIDRGELIGVCGHTGCGKSTLIQVISGLQKPDSGSVFLNGEDIYAKGYDKKKLRRAVGVVFQYPEYQLFEETVEQDVSYGPRKAGYDEQKTKECFVWAMEQIGLDPEEIGNMSPFELSGGQKRKVAIAGVLAMRPEVLILDEPIAGLDPAGRDEFMEFVSSLNRQGITIIMISHNMDGLCDYASRVVVMSEHRIIRDNIPEKVFSEVDCLKEVGLGTSETREIVEMLRKRGYDIPKNIIRRKELTDYLKEKLVR